MAKVTIHAGDFLEGASAYNFGILTLRTEEHSWIGEDIKESELQTVEMASEESVKRLGGTVGWGLAGAALFGPVGLLAGMLVGGRSKQVTFVGVFRDGRKLLATTDSKTYTKLLAACFESDSAPKPIKPKDASFRPNSDPEPVARQIRYKCPKCKNVIRGMDRGEDFLELCVQCEHVFTVPGWKSRGDTKSQR